MDVANTQTSMKMVKVIRHIKLYNILSLLVTASSDHIDQRQPLVSIVDRALQCVIDIPSSYRCWKINQWKGTWMVVARVLITLSIDVSPKSTVILEELNSGVIRADVLLQVFFVYEQSTAIRNRRR